MSRPKPRPTAERWEQVRGERLASPAAGAGYQRARRALELGKRIRGLREARGISQAELGRRIGSTQPAIARLEAGRVSPTLETLDRGRGSARDRAGGRLRGCPAPPGRPSRGGELRSTKVDFNEGVNVG